MNCSTPVGLSLLNFVANVSVDKERFQNCTSSRELFIKILEEKLSTDEPTISTPKHSTKKLCFKSKISPVSELPHNSLPGKAPSISSNDRHVVNDSDNDSNESDSSPLMQSMLESSEKITATSIEITPTTPLNISILKRKTNESNASKEIVTNEFEGNKKFIEKLKEEGKFFDGNSKIINHFFFSC